MALLLLGGCDFFLRGTYEGQCDDPSPIYGDGGDPMTARQSNCQVKESNICCRKPSSLVPGQMGNDHQPYCLRSYQCYLATKEGACLSDIDCVEGLACIDSDRKAKPVRFGSCRCPHLGETCLNTKTAAAFCCYDGQICGETGCVTPTPDMAEIPDMASPPGEDMGVPDDMAAAVDDGSST